MSKMPYTDWKEWATKRPDWVQQDMASAFERFVERKWQDALNVAAAELASWSLGKGRTSPGGGAPDKIIPTSKGTLKVTGAVNVVEQKASFRPPSPTWDVSFGRKCRARNLIGCDGEHVLLQCSKLLGMKLDERKEVLEKSGLCLFCLKHSVDLECYGRGGLSKPRCARAGCDGEHTPSMHELMGEEGASVNLVAEDDDGWETEEDEEWWVGTIGAEELQEEGETTPRGMSEPEPWREARFATGIFTRRDGSESGCLGDTHNSSYVGASEEDRWWSPEPPHATSEEDEDEVQYLMHVLGLEPLGGQTNPSINSAAREAEAESGETAATPGASRRKGPKSPRGIK